MAHAGFIDSENRWTPQSGFNFQFDAQQFIRAEFSRPLDGCPRKPDRQISRSSIQRCDRLAATDIDWDRQFLQKCSFRIAREPSDQPENNLWEFDGKTGAVWLPPEWSSVSISESSPKTPTSVFKFSSVSRHSALSFASRSIYSFVINLSSICIKLKAAGSWSENHSRCFIRARLQLSTNPDFKRRER